MKRRQFVEYGIGAAGVIVLSGCVSNSGEGINANQKSSEVGQKSDSDRDPEETVRAFLRAAEAGERNTVDSLVHPEGELSDQVDKYVERGESVEFETIQTEMAVQVDGKAFVTVEGKGHDENGGEVTIDTVYELRAGGGMWRIYADPGRVPLKYRLKDVRPADSFEVKIGRSEDAAALLFTSADVATVDLKEGPEGPVVIVSFTGDQIEQIQETASGLGDDLNAVKMFEYLDEELIRTLEVTPGLARSMQTGQWAADPTFALSYEDTELAERVAATLLEEITG